ncbi:MAG: hypothetical protein COA62_03385 [Rhodobiaceae bacterium]|nr:MAG: hypothetical protein COA62_03385 [Rhodobiaceae bacterium]
MSFRAVLSCFVLVAICACAPARNFDSAALSRQALVELSPQSLRSNLALSQSVKGELLGEGRSVRFELDIENDRLVLVGLTHTGVPLFTVTQTGDNHVFTSTIPQNIAFAPEFLLADIKFVYWPIETLNLAIGALQSRVVESSVNGHRHRALKDEFGQTVVDVSYPKTGLASGTLVVRHYDIPYILRIKTLPAQGGEAR